MSRSLPFFLVLVSVFGASCGGGKDDKAPAGGGDKTGDHAGDKPAGGAVLVDLKDAGKITGKVTFEGAAPAPSKKDTAADPYCSKVNAEGYIFEDVVANPNKTLKNVVVFIKKGLEGKKFPPPANTAVVDQKNCRYIPHVQVVRAGQKLKVTNSDETMHNVHSVSSLNTTFNKAQATKGKEDTFEEITKAGEVVKLKCDVHNFMEAHLYVLAHPCGAVTGDDGTFTIENVPPGEYEIQAWHEKLLTLPAVKVKVDAKGTVTQDFNYKL